MNWPAFFAAFGTAVVVWWVRYYGGPWIGSLWMARARVPEEFDTQPRTSERDDPEALAAIVPEPDPVDEHAVAAILLTHEALDEEESNEAAADFVLWEFEIEERAR